MIAIEVKYLGPTNHRDARWKATSGNGHSLTMDQDYELHTEDNAVRVAKALAGKMKWGGNWVMGTSKDGWVFVNATNCNYAFKTI